MSSAGVMEVSGFPLGLLFSLCASASHWDIVEVAWISDSRGIRPEAKMQSPSSKFTLLAVSVGSSSSRTNFYKGR